MPSNPLIDAISDAAASGDKPVPIDNIACLSAPELLEEPGSATGGRDRGDVPGGGVAQPQVKRLLSSDHFTVGDTLPGAWTSIKCFRCKDRATTTRHGPDRNVERSFHKEKRSNESHCSVTRPRRDCTRKATASRSPADECAMPSRN